MEEEKLNTVTILKDGPIMIDGDINLIKSDDTIVEHKKTFLCRCGGSSNKPYCDGTHKKIDFKG